MLDDPTERARLILLGPGVVTGHVLAPVARQGADKLALVGEVVAAVMELRAVAVSRHANIGAVPVHAGGGENVGAIDRHALRLVEGSGVAVIDRGITARPIPSETEGRRGTPSSSAFVIMNDDDDPSELPCPIPLIMKR